MNRNIVAYLHVENGHYKEKFPLYEGNNTVGRSPSKNQIVIRETSISSVHCIIVCQNNKIAIIDLNSKNGVYLNVFDYPIKVGQKVVIDPKTQIVYISEVKCSFELVDHVKQKNIEKSNIETSKQTKQQKQQKQQKELNETKQQQNEVKSKQNQNDLKKQSNNEYVREKHKQSKPQENNSSIASEENYKQQKSIQKNNKHEQITNQEVDFTYEAQNDEKKNQNSSQTSQEQHASSNIRKKLRKRDKKQSDDKNKHRDSFKSKDKSKSKKPTSKNKSSRSKSLQDHLVQKYSIINNRKKAGHLEPTYQQKISKRALPTKKVLLSTFRPTFKIFERIQIVDSVEDDYEILVMGQFIRTFKLLHAICKGVPIVSSEWLLKCQFFKQLLKTSSFQINQHKNTIKKSLERVRSGQKIFKDYKFYFGGNTKTYSERMEQSTTLIKMCGGQVIKRITKNSQLDQSIIILMPKEATQKQIKSRIGFKDRIYSIQLILDSCFKQQIDWNNNKISI